VIAAGLERFSGVKGRLQRKPGQNGCTVIDDTYNANPSSMLAAIAVLAATPGHRVLVLGDMGELGEEAAQLHSDIGAKARKAGIDTLFALGELSRLASLAYGAGAQHYESVDTLVAALSAYLSINPRVTVLVKGSRFMRMERVVEAITEQATTKKGDLHAA
jgi:UDP-N-acetylmuramoyl-tripeptide--D-alanyl-D-alanine ligase